MNTLLELIGAYKSTLIIIGLVGVIILGAWLWHVSDKAQAVSEQKAKDDKFYTELIANSPVQTDTITIHKYIPRKDTSGYAAGIAKLDDQYRARIRALLDSTFNKDSLIAKLSTPYEGTISDSSFGVLTITYYPLEDTTKKFAWTLTKRPPIDSSLIIINNKKMVPIPFKVFALSADVNPVGQVYAGASYRFDNWVVYMSYQVVGKANGSNWYDKLRLGVSVYVF